ncbi:hypothetical protein OB919_01815 [Halobacteria archaeon AArc-curdl1]|uniref:Uncharacterized protein n=1 Tax=Natronosalvus hydrolyticus TaxID=2979988 RepID=A0AAP2Z5D9_9EURY|nr:hypothetical protein [Halobacteria archaeon AArc-curdl1]
MKQTRRRVLLGVGTGTAAVLAGCLGDSPNPAAGTDDDDDSDDTDDNGSGDDTGDDQSDEGDDTAEDTTDDGNDEESDSTDDDTETHTSGSIADYSTASYNATDDETSIERFRGRDDAEQYFTDIGNDQIDELIEDTDFDADLLAALETQGTNGCYELLVESIETSDEDGIDLVARAVDTSSDDEVCTDHIPNLGLLVRVVFDGEMPNQGSYRVIDGWGEEHGYSWASDSESDSETDE